MNRRSIKKREFYTEICKRQIEAEKEGTRNDAGLSLLTCRCFLAAVMDDHGLGFAIHHLAIDDDFGNIFRTRHVIHQIKQQFFHDGT